MSFSYFYVHAITITIVVAVVAAIVLAAVIKEMQLKTFHIGG